MKERLTTSAVISELAKKHGMTPQSFYGLQEQFFNPARPDFEKKRGPKQSNADQSREFDKLRADNDRMRIRS